MKRFLRYFIYRELYRMIRNAGNNSKQSNSKSRKPFDPDKPEDNLGHPDPGDAIPLEDGPIKTVGELQTVLQQMDPYDFEYFIADLWERMGWSTEVSSASMDEGVDVVARKSTPYDQTVLIQAKRYGPNTTVGSPDIQQYASLSRQYNGIDKVLVITTNEFTGQAMDLAERLNVKTINGEQLAELVGQNQALDLVVEYIDFVEAVENEPAESDPAETHVEPKGEPNAAQETTETPTGTGGLSSTVWKKATIAATVAWPVVFFSVGTISDALWGLLFFSVWLGLPIVLYLDARTVREHVDWPRHAWAYVLGSLVWLLAVIPAGIYLWRRRSFSKETTESTQSDPSSSTSTDEAGQSSSSVDPHEESESGGVPADEDSTHADSPGEGTDQDTVSTSEDVDDWMHVEYAGERYFTQTARSPNGDFVVAYKDGRRVEGSPEPGRVFLLTGGEDDDELAFTTEIARPNACAVANDGTVAVVDWNLDWGDELSGTFHVFTRTGNLILRHEFDSNLGQCAITPDGSYAATSTYNPDCTTYIFDTQGGSLLTEHENQHGNVDELEFVDQGGSWMLRLGDPNEDSAYGVDVAGHVVWKSEGLQRQERLESLLESTAEADLHEALDLLNEAAELASKDWEHRNIAQRAANAHWQLAKTVKQEHGVTEEWWQHMEQAYEKYVETLPRYDGKQGAAKVQRALGKQYLRDDEEEKALECFEEIERLEDEYDVQLLTDADQRRLNDLSSSLESA